MSAWGDIVAQLVEDNAAVIDTSSTVLALLHPSVPWGGII